MKNHREVAKAMNKNHVIGILIIALVLTAVFVPTFLWLTRPCVIKQPESANWQETFTWIDENIEADTIFAAWGINGDYISLFTNCSSVITCGGTSETTIGLVAAQFLATNETESINILQGLYASYVLVSWSFFYPNCAGDEYNWQSMAQHIDNASSIWNETSYKPTCSFFNTTIWKMLTYNETFIDYDTDPFLVEYLITHGYPLGYFEARLNWADPWQPGSQPELGIWLDDAGHLWKSHNPPLGQGMVDDGIQDYDGNEDDDTVGIFANLVHFTPVFISSGHLIKIFQINI
jgi:hypothetical protein